MIVALAGLALVLAGAGYVLSFIRADLPAAAVDAHYISPQSRFLYLPGGGRIHYRDEGLRDAPVIVLLHGSNASLHTWEAWVARLGNEFRIITLDLPGHGLSGTWPSEDYSIDAYVELIHQFTRELGIEKFTLGGNSMGGHVSWRYALAWPDRIESLLLVNAGGWPRRDDESPPLIFRLLGSGSLSSLFEIFYIPALTENGVRSAYNYSQVADAQLIRRYHALNLREGQRGATIARFIDFFTQRQNITPPKDVLDMPVLIMWGEEDSLINVQRAHDFAAIMPNSVLTIYPDIGHIPMEELPDRSASDVRNFMSGVIRVQQTP